MDIQPKKLPGSIAKCEVCGEYRGEAKKKDINFTVPFRGEEGEQYISVSCFCDGISCPKCKKNKIHRPISNSYDPESNEIWHRPYFSGMRVCDECEKEKALAKNNNLLENGGEDTSIMKLPGFKKANFSVSGKTSENKKRGENILTVIVLGYIALLIISNYGDTPFSYIMLFLAVVVLVWRFSGFVKSKIIKTKPPQGLDVSKIKTVGEFHDAIRASQYYTASPDLYRGLKSLMKAKSITFPEAYQFLVDNKKIFLADNWYVYDLSANKLWEKENPDQPAKH